MSSKIFDYVIVDGERLLATNARTNIFNDAYLASFGIYETAKVDQGRPFYLEDHLHRLLRSAQLIDLNLNVDVPTLSSWFDRLYEVDPGATWGLRILVLGAKGNQGQPMIAMQANPLQTYPKRLYQAGAKAVLYEGLRALPACKSLNTLVNHMARQRAGQANALEGILHYGGYLTEGSRSSFFVVLRGRLVTAPEATVLPGITRELVLQVMQDTAHPVTEQPVLADLGQIEEAFISSTSMHVMPITQIDDRIIGSGQVGPITKLAMARFNSFYDRVMADAPQ